MKNFQEFVKKFNTGRPKVNLKQKTLTPEIRDVCINIVEDIKDLAVDLLRQRLEKGNIGTWVTELKHIRNSVDNALQKLV